MDREAATGVLLCAAKVLTVFGNTNIPNKTKTPTHEHVSVFIIVRALVTVVNLKELDFCHCYFLIVSASILPPKMKPKKNCDRTFNAHYNNSA